MTDDQSRRHTDVYLHSSEALLGNLLSLLGNGFQTIDEQTGDTRNEFHHSSHCYTEEQNLLDVELCCPTDESTNDNTKHQRFSQHTELLLQSLSINVEFRETRNAVEQPVDDNGEYREALTERLWNANALQVVVLLELLSSKVCHNEGDDVAHDSCEIAP